MSLAMWAAGVFGEAIVVRRAGRQRNDPRPTSIRRLQVENLPDGCC